MFEDILEPRKLYVEWESDDEMDQAEEQMETQPEVGINRGVNNALSNSGMRKRSWVLRRGWEIKCQDV